MTDSLLTRILSENPPAAYALLARQERGTLEVLVGDVADVDTLAEIPLHGPNGAAQQVLTLVPFRQVRERGYAAIDDGAPLRCLIVREREEIDLPAATALLPADLPTLTPHGFDVSDEDYTGTVRTVLKDEIGQGEGANFVIRRDFVAQAEGSPSALALATLRRLLERERGAYWTFAVVTDGVILAGASPERHVSVKDGVAAMNPISGTYRHPKGGVDPAVFSQFLLDTKEVEELFMVVDEELKMMSEVCADGGVVEGPYLKQMSRVTHTEYILRGHTSLDVRDVLRETMFAPTVTGSPMQNACAVIARHERRGRGYYSGVAALITPEGDGFELDAPILIRTAQISSAGEVRVSAGATLVRHSSPEGEVAETAGKAAGLLGALGLEAAYLAGFGAGVPAVPVPPEAVDEYSSSASRTVPDAAAAASADVILADDPVIHGALQARNKMLAPFWLAEQAPSRTPDLAGRNVVVVDAEDRFTTMLAHQLRHLGMNVRVVPWSDVAEDGELKLPDDVDFLDLIVSGPGPGDPTDLSETRIRRLRALAQRRMRDRAPLVAVCLSHQAVATELGIPLARLDEPRQGVQLEIDYFGTPARIGFYNTFTARVAPGSKPILPVTGDAEAAVDPATGDVFALRGRGLATLQGHAESILSIDGLTILERMVRHALA
ncbi:phenazine biosynthesis protein PhzE [Rarobacter faecitabidus]|uniref:anthranilate synthase n=1 Tax=Rarobacter faecitabidus TaxID=13243 RepID=A0A542ZA04_RARFA|nr:anthranilate synthase family protein [Rarobacter faecitabidus]TQL57162.1 phenazine biosynthesis protein phzE [Rarobacter faecitabidus]